MPKPADQDVSVEKIQTDRDPTNERRRFVEALTGTMRQPVLVLDGALRVEMANRAFYRTFEIDEPEVTGRLVYELGRGQWHIPRLHDLLETVLADDTAVEDYEIEHDFADLGRRIMVLNARRVDDMQLILLAIEDRTATRPADRGLVDSEPRLRRVLDNLFLFVGLLTPEGIVIETNRAPLEVAGIAPVDVRGRRFEECDWWSYSAGARARVRRAVARAAQGECVRFDAGIQAAGGRLTIDFMLAPLRDEAGLITGLVASAVDITKSKQAQQAMCAAMEAAEAANALKSRFVAATSHDLRQPLQTIGLLGAALTQKTTDAASLKILERHRETVTAMGDILDSLLDIDRLDTGQMERQPASFPVQRMLARLRSQFGYVAETRGVDLRMAGSSAIIRSDPQLLERLVGNLVSNAIKYTEAGGRVLIGCRRRGDTLRIEVHDSGVGIPEDQLDRIFDEYYRLTPASGSGREPGLGLGLALVRRLSDLLRHRVEVRSGPAGSTFAVAVPLAHAGQGRGPRLAGPSGEAKADGRQGGAVLLIEDEAGPRESLRMLLEQSDYQVRAVASARQALVPENTLSAPQLVVADYRLGATMTGVHAIRSLRAATGCDFPAIVLTGDSSRETRREIEKADCRYELKPVNPDHLLALVGQLVRQACMTGVLRRTPDTPVPTSAPEPALPTGKTVFVVEDDRKLRGAVCALLEAAGHRVERCATGEAFLQLSGAGARQGCVVLDVGLPGMSGLLVQERLTAEGVTLPVVVITGRHEVPLAVQAMRAGAIDFLEKPFDAARLLAAVDRALKHAASFQAAAPQSGIAEITAIRFASLTPREREVLGLVAAGHPNKEVAHRLGINQRTVENHRARGMHRLGVRSLADLVRLAVAAEAGGVRIFSA